MVSIELSRYLHLLLTMILQQIDVDDVGPVLAVILFAAVDGSRHVVCWCCCTGVDETNRRENIGCV